MEGYLVLGPLVYLTAWPDLLVDGRLLGEAGHICGPSYFWVAYGWECGFFYRWVWG